MSNRRTFETVTIPSGAAITGAIDLGDEQLARIVIPAAWTTANLSFQTSVDGTTYNDLYDANGVEYTVTVGGVSRAILVPLVDFIGVRYLKIRSGTTASAVNQAADRNLKLVMLP